MLLVKCTSGWYSYAVLPNIVKLNNTSLFNKLLYYGQCQPKWCLSRLHMMLNYVLKLAVTFLYSMCTHLNNTLYFLPLLMCGVSLMTLSCVLTGLAAKLLTSLVKPYYIILEVIATWFLSSCHTDKECMPFFLYLILCGMHFKYIEMHLVTPRLLIHKFTTVSCVATCN